MTNFKKPAVGTWVKVTTDYSAYKRNFSWINQRKFEIVGKVVESNSWDAEGSFNLLTTDPNMPIKTIELKFVVALEQVRAQLVHHQTQNAFKKVLTENRETDRVFEIKGSRGNDYVVTKSGFTWSCNCIAGERGRRCKHVAEAQLKLKAEKV